MPAFYLQEPSMAGQTTFGALTNTTRTMMSIANRHHDSDPIVAAADHASQRQGLRASVRGAH